MQQTLQQPRRQLAIIGGVVFVDFGGFGVEEKAGHTREQRLRSGPPRGGDEGRVGGAQDGAWEKRERYRETKGG